MRGERKGRERVREREKGGRGGQGDRRENGGRGGQGERRENGGRGGTG